MGFCFYTNLANKEGKWVSSVVVRRTEGDLGENAVPVDIEGARTKTTHDCRKQNHHRNERRKAISKINNSLKTQHVAFRCAKWCRNAFQFNTSVNIIWILIHNFTIKCNGNWLNVNISTIFSSLLYFSLCDFLYDSLISHLTACAASNSKWKWYSSKHLEVWRAHFMRKCLLIKFSYDFLSSVIWLINMSTRVVTLQLRLVGLRTSNAFFHFRGFLMIFFVFFNFNLFYFWN